MRKDTNMTQNMRLRVGKRVGSVALAGLLTVGMIVPTFGMAATANAAETEPAAASTTAPAAKSQAPAAESAAKYGAASGAKVEAATKSEAAPKTEAKTPTATASKAAETVAPKATASVAPRAEAEAPAVAKSEAKAAAPKTKAAAPTQKAASKAEAAPAATAPAVDEHSLAGQDGTVVVVAPAANNAQIETNLNQFLGGYTFGQPTQTNGKWTVQATLSANNLSNGWTMVMSKFTWLNPPVKVTDFEKAWTGTNYTATFTYDDAAQKWALTTPVKLAAKAETTAPDAPAQNDDSITAAAGALEVVPLNHTDVFSTVKLNLRNFNYSVGNVTADGKGGYTVGITVQVGNYGTWADTEFLKQSAAYNGGVWDRNWGEQNLTATFAYDAAAKGWKLVTPAKYAVNIDVKKVTVSFDTDNAGTIADQTVDYGTKLTEPAAPTKDGYTFDGWYKDDKFAEKFDFTKPVDSFTDFTLYAKWTEDKPAAKSYTLSFESNGGSEVAAQTVRDGEKAVKPAADPTREGYRFAGWYLDEGLTKAVDWTGFTITADTTVYAKWTEESNPQPAPEVRLSISGRDVKDGRLTLKVGESRDLVGSIDVKSLRGARAAEGGEGFTVRTLWTSSDVKVAGFDKQASFVDKDLQDTQRLVAVGAGRATVTFAVLDPATGEPVEGLAPATLEVTVVSGGTAPKTEPAAKAESTVTTPTAKAGKQPLARTGAGVASVAMAMVVLAAAGAVFAIARRRQA